MLLAALLIGFYFPWLVGQQSYFKSDLTYYFQPFTDFIAEGFRAGRMPLWNPYVYCGMSQAAVPSPGIFYPPGILFAFIPFSQAIAWQMVLHQLLAGCGAFLLITSLGWGALAGSVCGFAIALSGYMFALPANYTLVATAAWLPILLFFVRSIQPMHSRANVARMFGAAICMFSMISAGRGEIFVPASLTVGSYIVATAYGAYREDNMPKQALVQAGLRILSLFAGCLMALPVILPALEWVRLSPRSKGLELQWVLMWSANWYDCLGLVAAQPVGDITILGSKFLNLVASRQNSLPYVASSYVGPVIFTLAIWSLFDKNWRWRFLLLAMLIAGLLMAMGNYTPVAPFITKLSPAFASFRYPVKLLIIPVLVLALMAARGACLAMDKEVRKSAQICTIVIWSLMLLTGITFLLSPQLHLLTAKFPWYVGRTVNFQLMQEAQFLFGRTLAVTGGLGLLMSANYFAYKSEQLTKELFAFLTGGTLLLTLMMPAVAYLRDGTIGDFYRRPHSLAEKLAPLVKGQGKQSFASRVQPFYHDPLSPGDGFLAREKLPYQYGFFLFTRELVLPNTNVDFKIPYAFGYEAAEDGFYKHLFADAIGPSTQNRTRAPEVQPNDLPLARFCQMTSVSHVITQAYTTVPVKDVLPLDKDAFTLFEENKPINYRIYKTRYSVPRAYFASSIRWDAKKPDFAKRILDRSSKQMLTETFVEGPPIGGIVDGAQTSSNDRIEFLIDEPEQVDLKVETSSPKLLVLTDRLYPGWNAQIDGKPVEMRLVNFFARGVPISPGVHTIEFVYSPISVWGGLAAAAAVLLIFAAAFVLAPGPRNLE